MMIVDETKIVVIDFGGARETNVDTNTLIGSPGYVAREVYSRDYNTKKVDTPSLGIILFELAFNYLPELFKKTETVERFLSRQKVSQEMKDLILLMIEENVDLRITLSEVEKHPFLRDAKRAALQKELNDFKKVELMRRQLELLNKQFGWNLKEQNFGEELVQKLGTVEFK